MAKIVLEADPRGIVQGGMQAESALDRVKREAIAAETALDRLGGRGSAAVNGLGAASHAAGGFMDRYGYKVQQAGLQMGDFATQVAGGTSAAVAFAQQGTQLLGMFGTYGALAGAALAITLPLGAAFLSAGDDAKSLADALDEADEAIASFRDAMQAAFAPTEDLFRQFGSASPALREALLDLANIEKLKVFDAMRTEIGALAQSIADIGGENMTAATQAFLGFSRNSEDARAAAANFRQALDELATTEDPVRRLAAALDMKRIIKEAAEAQGGMTDAQKQANEALTRMVVQLEAMGVSAHQSAEGMTALDAAILAASGNVDPLLSKMGALSDSAWSAARGIIAFAQKQGEMAALSAAVYGPDTAPTMPSGLGNFMGQPVDFSALADDRGEAIRENRAGIQDARNTRLARTQKAWLDEYGKPPKTGGGGRGGKSAAQQAGEDYDRLIGSLDEAVRAEQEFAEAQAIVNAALATGHISAEQAASTIAMAREEMEKAKLAADDTAGAWQDMFEAGGSAIDRLITGTGKLGDVLKETLADMAALLLRNSLLGSVAGGLATDSTGTLIAKGLFGGFFDGGGTLPMGSWGIVGERGPERIMSTPAGTVVTSRMDTEMMGGRAAQIEIVGGGLELTDNGQIMARVQAVSRQSAQAAYSAAITDTRRNLGAWNDQYQRDGALA